MSKLLKSFLPKRDGGTSNSPHASDIVSSNTSSTTSQDILLTLTHLRKVFYEYQHPKLNWTQQDKNDRLYSTLPMVIKVLSVLSNHEWTERFPELNEYTLTLAKLLVYEIRQRADKEPNSSAASQSIIEYLEINDEMTSTSGWSLLRSLKLLSTGPNILMDKFAQASLPSTFVKCLYLFFDLPDIIIQHGHHDTISPKEKRILLQQAFFQVTSFDNC
jgi:WD repeat and FYVE domain-containing protein 3